MAAASCRVLCLVRSYNISRVLSVSSSLATTHHYRNETWCKRWWYISQRNLSLTTKYFAPNFTPVLTKGVADPNPASTDSPAKSKPPKSANGASLPAQSKETAVPDVVITYHQGLPRITVPLPSRNERCIFTLKPITHTVGDFINMLKKEDSGINTAVLSTADGVRISSSNSIETLMENNFQLTINDIVYTVNPPVTQRTTLEEVQKLSDIQVLIGQLYNAFHVREYNVNMEKEMLLELEDIRLQLEPLEQKLEEIEKAAMMRAAIFHWSGLGFMVVQLVVLAKLTWWDYSWDIVEPFTFFSTYCLALIGYVYFLVTNQEYSLPDVFRRRHLISMHKVARKRGLDLNQYNLLKEQECVLKIALKTIRGPLHEYKQHREQKKQAIESESSSESSSSSSSPSPSPSRSPSPEKHVSKKTSTVEMDLNKVAAVAQEFKFS